VPQLALPNSVRASATAVRRRHDEGGSRKRRSKGQAVGPQAACHSQRSSSFLGKLGKSANPISTSPAGARRAIVAGACPLPACQSTTPPPISRWLARCRLATTMATHRALGPASPQVGRDQKTCGSGAAAVGDDRGHTSDGARRPRTRRASAASVPVDHDAADRQSVTVLGRFLLRGCRTRRRFLSSFPQHHRVVNEHQQPHLDARSRHAVTAKALQTAVGFDVGVPPLHGLLA
jgi:hypothetical protein